MEPGELAQLASLYSGATPDNSVNKVTGYGIDDLESIPDRGKIFVFSTTSRLTPRYSQPPIQWVPKSRSSGKKRPEREGISLILRLMRGTSFPPFHELVLRHRVKFTFRTLNGFETWPRTCYPQIVQSFSSVSLRECRNCSLSQVIQWLLPTYPHAYYF
jgi:hypothetical protein